MRTVVHVLAVHRSNSGECDVTATIRQGELVEGQTAWFAGDDGARREVQVTSCREGRRHLRIELEGAADELKSGTYLYTD